MTFRVGQKVVCVDAEGHGKYIPPGFKSDGDMHGLVKNEVYTVRKVDAFIGVPCVWLEEIYRDGVGVFARDDCGFCVNRFRPLIEKSTDTGMAVFREILDRETDKPPVKAKPRKSLTPVQDDGLKNQ